MSTDRAPLCRLPDEGDRGVSRREFLASCGWFAAVTTLMQPGRLPARWIATANAISPSGVVDAFNGLLAFVVPGADPYSVAQGVSTPEPGGVEAGVTQILIDTFEESAPYQPNFSAIVAGILDDLASVVDPSADGFAGLRFAEKVVVFQIMDSTDPIKPLAALLPAITAFIAFSEAGVFDPNNRQLTGEPVGWEISGYEGVADGRDELVGHYQPRGR